MKEIMDTRLVEGYIFLFEVLDMVGKECQHVFLAVIGFLAQCLVGQCADTAVALQGALAYLEQHTQVLIVEKADAFRDGGLSFLSPSSPAAVRPDGRAVPSASASSPRSCFV